MIIPIRCFTCGKIIASHYNIYDELCKSKMNDDKILDILGIKRYCCRRMIKTHVDMIDKILLFDNDKNDDNDDDNNDNDNYNKNNNYQS